MYAHRRCCDIIICYPLPMGPYKLDCETTTTHRNLDVTLSTSAMSKATKEPGKHPNQRARYANYYTSCHAYFIITYRPFHALV